MLKNFFLMILTVSVFTGCVRDWGHNYAKGPVGQPVSFEDSFGLAPADNEVRTVAVLLPLSGPDGALGTGIQHAIEIAFFQKQPDNVLVSFHDIAGREADKRRTMQAVVAQEPNLIIGPLFANDVELLGEIRPANIPAITFTSSRAPLGNGIFTMALLPNQAIETIVKHMQANGRENVLIIAPDTNTGWMLANAAKDSARAYNISVAGLVLYVEGDNRSMREVVRTATFNEARVRNLAEARRILSDTMMRNNLTMAESIPLQMRLEELNRMDTLGGVPYDAVLILGNATDSKTIAAFLRYYDVTPRMAGFYGSALWDTDIAFRDGAMAGGEFAALPRISPTFVELFSEIEGVRPNRFNTLGYDAAMLAIRALAGNRSVGAILLDPSGYVGIDGLVRLRPEGINERALNVMQLNGVGQPRVIRPAPTNFMTPIYKTGAPATTRPQVRRIPVPEYNPMDHITLPARLQPDNPARQTGQTPNRPTEDIVLVGESTEVIPGEAPARGGTVSRQNIDEVRMRPAQ